MMKEQQINDLQGDNWQLIENSQDCYELVRQAFGTYLRFAKAATWYNLPWKGYGLLVELGDGEINEIYLYEGIPYLAKTAYRIYWRDEQTGIPAFINLPLDWRQQCQGQKIFS